MYDFDPTTNALALQPQSEVSPLVAEQRLTVGQRLGHLFLAAVEAPTALLALSGEVDPHTPGQFVRDLVLSGIAVAFATEAWQTAKSAFTGRNESYVQKRFKNQQKPSAQ